MSLIYNEMTEIYSFAWLLEKELDEELLTEWTWTQTMKSVLRSLPWEARYKRAKKVWPSCPVKS